MLYYLYYMMLNMMILICIVIQILPVSVPADSIMMTRCTTVG